VGSSRIITDPEVRQLAALAESLESEYVDPDKDPWLGSPFRWIQTRPSRQKGAIGELLVAGWAATKGFDVTRATDSDADRVINGQRVEIKYSNLWADLGIYKFQQIRNQDYDYVFCLGLSPYAAHAWFIPKSELMYDRGTSLVPQHGGASGKDTRWLSFPANNPPDWLEPFGGTLGKVRDLIEAAGQGSHVGRALNKNGRKR
jgi:hypothetical protein